MKNIFLKTNLFLVVALSMLIVTSCEKEGAGAGEEAESKIVGTWTVSDSEIEINAGGLDVLTLLMTIYQIPETEAQEMIDLFTQEIEANFDGTITFKEDKTYKLIMPDNTEEGTWSISSNGKILTLTPNDTNLEADDVTIESLESTTAVIKFDEQQEVDIDDDGVDDFTLDLVIKLTLTK